MSLASPPVSPADSRPSACRSNARRRSLGEPVFSPSGDRALVDHRRASVGDRPCRPSGRSRRPGRESAAVDREHGASARHAAALERQ